MKLAMIGSGYVGLVSGACFTDFGDDLICVDKDGTKIENLNNKIMQIYEPGLADLVNRNVDAECLSFSTDLAKSIPGNGRQCPRRPAEYLQSAGNCPNRFEIHQRRENPVNLISRS